MTAEVGDVSNLSYFSSVSVNMFSLGPDGLVKNETIVTSSEIEVVIKIDNVKAYPFSNAGSLSFQTVLSCSNATFMETYVGSPTIAGSTSSSSSTSGADLSTNVVYGITESGTTELTIVYPVTDQTNASGESMADLYYPSASRPTFSFVARGLAS